ncbi:uncharacterized protein EDB91DRAFT_1185622 [Suillus paluster]|uniref:uncharacterized protein n=1 Tax=Suillus paluster TaxID=48578 RepID=UPI001B871410|nr:uncharacterized protein EDB91DRAFT_1185622 [Suillus paluster]KAG1718365.1 hypothetical protein EDB91DRAFT_1185622 [Suillus paluster]
MILSKRATRPISQDTLWLVSLSDFLGLTWSILVGSTMHHHSSRLDRRDAHSGSILLIILIFAHAIVLSNLSRLFQYDEPTDCRSIIPGAGGSN